MVGNPEMEKKFEYRGDLGVTPLPEILATIGRYRVPGMLEVSSGTRARCIYFDGGAVIFADGHAKFTVSSGAFDNQVVCASGERSGEINPASGSMYYWGCD